MNTRQKARFPFAAIVLVLGFNTGCHHHEKKPVKGTMNCATGQPVVISNPDKSGKCKVDCFEKSINSGESVDWVSESRDGTFDIDFVTTPKLHPPHPCNPGHGSGIPGKHVPVPGHGNSGPLSTPGCYEYSISYNGTQCNDPNIVVK